MDLSRLETLKQTLLESRDFMEVWNYFMTHFAEVEGFMDLGENYSSPALEAIVAQLAQVIGAPTPVSEVMLIRLPGQRFVHGAAMLGHRLANLIYFEDIGVGLVGIVMSASGENRVIRFTTGTTPGGGLSRN
jgi:hypothetical protein